MRADFSSAVISDRLQALTRALDKHPTEPGKLLIYTSPVPVAGGDPDVAVLLSSCPFNKPSLDNVTGSILTLKMPITSMVLVSGAPAWARAVDGYGVFVGDFDVGVPGDNAAVIVDNGATPPTLQLYAGGEFTVVLAGMQET